MTCLHLDRLGAVSLAELNVKTELLTRVDRKYLIPLAEAQGLVDELVGVGRVLEVESRRQFSYASTYFDTPHLDSYLMAAHRRRRGFKLRTRSYLDSALCFLELKTSGPRGVTVKERIDHDPTGGDRLEESDRRFVADCLVLAGVCDRQAAIALAETLRPVIATTYARATIQLPDEEARITLDTSLSWSGRGPVSPEGDAAVESLAIVETKSPAKPLSVDKMLWARGRRPEKISKYGTGLALLRSGLPANKWHRVMQRDLIPALTPVAG